MFSLEDIFKQAFADNKSVRMIENGYQSASLLDVKVVKDDYTHKIDLLNTSRRYYKPITESELFHFKDNGWRKGVYVVTLSNYSSKLDEVERSIRDEVNGKSNEKSIKQLKATRESLMSDYNKLNNKLNEQTKL